MDGRKSGWINPILENPSSYRRGSKKCNCSARTFKSERYRVGRRSKKEIFASQSACKKISSIHKFVLQIQNILRSHELNGQANF